MTIFVAVLFIIQIESLLSFAGGWLLVMNVITGSPHYPVL